MIILTILATGAISVICFVLGAMVGQTVAKGEDIKLPNINPVEAIKELSSKKKAEAEAEAEAERNKVETILHNIDSYDGTANGQKDVPRG